MAGWTPLKSYETAVTCCIQATQEFASARKAYRTGLSAGVVTHTPSTCTLEDSRRRKVENFESIMTKAYILLTVEASRTHNTDPRIGTIFANDYPPSYEQATCRLNENASGLASDVRVLKDREQAWRCWWRSLTESSPAMTGQCDNVTQENYNSRDRILGRSVVDKDEKMKQVSAYLQDVEHGARRFLQEIDQTMLHQQGNCEESKNSSERETTSDQETQLAALNGQHRFTAPQEQSQLQQDSSPKTLIFETLQHGICTWISRPFSWASRNDGHQRRQHRIATTTGSTQSNRQHGEAEPCPDTELEFRPFQVQALYSYEREYERSFRKRYLSFTAGQVIDVVGIVDRNWLLGEYIDCFRKFHFGTFSRNYTIPWHPEICKRGEVSASNEPANSHNEAFQRLQSLSDWLQRERQHYDLNEGRDLKADRLSHHNIPALVERLDVLRVVLNETYRPRRSLELEVEEMVERMENLRTKATDRMMEYQAFVDADLFR